jgi:transcriptional regulator with XRE-family HTH domain
MNQKHQKDANRQLDDIAKQISARRKHLGLSQERLAEKLGVSVETVKRIEQREGWISLQMLHHICREMDIKIAIG